MYEIVVARQLKSVSFTLLEQNKTLMSGKLL